LEKLKTKDWLEQVFFGGEQEKIIPDFRNSNLLNIFQTNLGKLGLDLIWGVFWVEHFFHFGCGKPNLTLNC